MSVMCQVGTASEAWPLFLPQQGPAPISLMIVFSYSPLLCGRLHHSENSEDIQVDFAQHTFHNHTVLFLSPVVYFANGGGDQQEKSVLEDKCLFYHPQQPIN